MNHPEVLGAAMTVIAIGAPLARRDGFTWGQIVAIVICGATASVGLFFLLGSLDVRLS